MPLQTLFRSFRLSFLPPLMVYVAAGISGLTGIVGTFFVKEYLGLSAQFLAALGFWLVLPWTLKMPVGHVVDLLWRWKAGFVFLGAAFLMASIAIMLGLLLEPQAMRALMPADRWYVLAAVLSPVGYMLQDVVADAMTVEAVPHRHPDGRPVAAEELRAMHTTMQTLGRVAIVGGTIVVALINVGFLSGVEALPREAKAAAYANVYASALAIPLISIAGVVIAALMRRGVVAGGDAERARPPVNWWVLGGGLAFAVVSVAVGLADLKYGQEVVFVASMCIVVVLILRLVRELDADARATLLGTALVIFVFRAMPGPGAGASWWGIDVLGFDPAFLAKLSMLSGLVALAGLLIYRRFFAQQSIYQVVGWLTVLGSVMALPQIGMAYGLHEWTAARTGGVVDARFIAILDTALESPLGQVAMVPMLAWIANSAPATLKATYFAVMASFTNLALSAAQLGTKYLNRAFVVSREVRDAASGAVKVPADYSEIGVLLITCMALGLVVPLATIVLVRAVRLKGA
ncbi:MAG: hypothetical protein JNM90_17850 [Burkholderiales bacterium]|nr:hypothetical protein [Burkholderiales bacterium]